MELCQKSVIIVAIVHPDVEIQYPMREYTSKYNTKALLRLGIRLICTLVLGS
jgi:hypothetical protein